MTTTGDSSRKARKLRTGDAVMLKGQAWTVDETKRDKAGARVHLKLSRGVERVASWVPEAKVFELQGLIATSGAQNRWASKAEAAKVERRFSPTPERRRLAAPATKPLDDGATPELDPWVPSTDAEQAVAAIMGGTLLGAQRDPDTGLWFVPPVDGSTVLAHLLTFHATEPTSTPLAEVRTPMAEQLDTAAEALMRADIAGALALHQRQHAEALPDGATPHRHA